MKKQKYGTYIFNQIRDWPANAPITNIAVAAALAAAFNIDIDNAKKITNVNLKRQADKNELMRIQKGIYGKVKETPFGKLTPSSDEIMARLLLRDGENVIGYLTGPTLLNVFGLCSWIPRVQHIASNHYRRQLPENVMIRIHKPIDIVNDENAPYLQIIEAFTAIEQYPVDAENPEELLRGVLTKNQIENTRLIWYARRHCKYKTLLKIIDVALGGIDDEASYRQ